MTKSGARFLRAEEARRVYYYAQAGKGVRTCPASERGLGRNDPGVSHSGGVSVRMRFCLGLWVFAAAGGTTRRQIFEKVCREKV